MYEQRAQHTLSQDVDTDESEYDDVWPTRMPNSTLRYTGLDDATDEGQEQQAPRHLTPIQKRQSAVTPGRTYIPPGSYVQGNTRFTVHNGAPPTGKKQNRAPRPNVNTANPPDVIYGQSYRDTEEPTTPKKGRLRSTFQAHPMLYLGIGMLIALLLWVVGSWLYAWGSNEWNDWHYGRPRTFQIDAVVGHNDSPQHPSHFIAINLNGRVQVIEEPGGEASKAKIYLITQLYGQGAALAPITLTFEDSQQNGKPEMLVHVQGSVIVYLNQNGQFVPQPQQ